MEKYLPNGKEIEVLTLFYNRFYDLYEEITNDNFWGEDAQQRFFKLREAFSIYKELLSYEPIKSYVEWMKKGGRPPLEGIVADGLFSFIRNLLLHFPIFKTWDEVYINKNMATWSKAGQINKFLHKCTQTKMDGRGVLHYRIWEVKKKKMTYFDINFPEKYDEDNIYLKDIISEEAGIKLCMALMRNILDKQVENADEPDIIIMSQVYIPIKIKLLKEEGIYLGIDGCKGGWIIAVYEAGKLCIEKYISVEDIFKKYPKFENAFIDMVIGLPSSAADIRPDTAARKILKGRGPTIFSVPSRQALYEETEKKQKEANIAALGKSLSPPTLGIIPKMRELDQFLDKYRNYANAIQESHPEVCFARLNGTVVMTKKKEYEGLAQRVTILEKYLPELTVKYVKEKARILKCNTDDIVDAIVLVVTANLNSQGLCETIPENVMEDAKGLKMQMVIPKGPFKNSPKW